MKTSTFRVALLSACLGLCPALVAQSWDAATQATGWARQDKDDSFTFYDEPSSSLHVWSRDGGLQRSTLLGKLPVAPEKWVIDPHNKPWVISGRTLVQLGSDGKVVKTTKLPAEVSDVGWDVKGILLSYRAPEPYLEKRDFNGSVIWSFGGKPPSDAGPAPLNQRPVLVDDAGNVLMASGASLNVVVLNGATGRKVTETTFRLPDGSPAPPLEGTGVARGPMVLWPGKEVVFAVVKAAQVPAQLRASIQGLALARLDLTQMRAEFLPTGLNESHFLIGVLDSNAVFVSPKGGLVLVKVQ